MTPSSDKFLELPEVLERVKHSRTAWYQAIKENRAPKQIKLGRKSVWSEHQISDFIESLKTEAA